MNGKCRNCRWWYESNFPKYGECRYNPPVFQGSMFVQYVRDSIEVSEGLASSSRYPFVREDGTCHHYEENLEKR